MNKVVLMGRLTRDPEVRYSAGENALAIARYTLAVDRRFRRDGEASADFIPCVSFGRTAEFAEKYFRQGLKVIVTGHMKDEIDYKSCETIEELKILIDDYMDYYNNERCQWNLKKKSRENFLENFKKVGIN